MIRVATKTVAINPPDEFYMLGYISPERALPALGVKDDLRAVLLLLETGRKRLLFAGLDAGGSAKRWGLRIGRSF